MRAVRVVAVSNPVVLIDGPSGVGKSSLAARVVAAWPTPGRVQLVALDSLYPGWGGLADGVELAREEILVPHARDRIGVWQRYDWASGQRAEAHAVDPSLPLVVEGSGALTPRTHLLCDIAVWVTAPTEVRRKRALDRDGETYAPHWDMWAAQEAEHVAANAPAELADISVELP